MEKNKIKLGIAPIGWTNDDMPDLGSEISFDRCITEMSEAGYVGCEVGNKYPTNPSVLLEKLKLLNLQIANRWFSSFILTKPFNEVEKDFRVSCEFLKAVGAKIIGVSEQSYSVQGQLNTPIFGNKYVLNDEEWNILCVGMSKLGYIAKEYGITLTYHHHMGTVVQTEKEIDKFMNLCDSNSVYLLYDCGHLAYCKEDYIGVLTKYIDRIRHIHLKDVRIKEIDRVEKEKLSFLQGVRNGTFTVPGDGDSDFDKIFEIIIGSNYKGWLIVEAEQDPAKANPFDYAVKARKFINKKLDI